MIAIVDYGMGNLASVVNAFLKIQVDAHATADPEQIRRADGIVIPGVGAFDAGVRRLRDAGLDTAVRDAAQDGGVSVLGICLGLHLLCEGSEEGREPGLGLLPLRVVRFRAGRLKVPHMGWNTVRTSERTNALFDGVEAEAPFYFAHSYHLAEADSMAAGWTSYGVDFVAAVRRDGVMGTQFHPEKSQAAGLRLLSNFANLV